MTNQSVAFVLPTLTVGGAERVTVNLINELADRGHDCDMVLLEAFGEFLDDLDSSVMVHDLDCGHARYSLPGLYSYIKHHDPDVVIPGMTRMNVFSLLATQLVRNSPPCCVVEHNVIKRDRLLSRNSAAYQLAKLLYPRADRVIGVSDGVVSSLETDLGLEPESLEVIHNAVVSGALIESRETGVDHPYFGDDVTTYLSVGSLTEQKNYPLLLEAFAELTSNEDARLVLVGEGPQKDQLQRKISALEIEDRVDIVGYVEDVYAYMRAADVFCLSSNWEGLPTVLIEALACGTTVVSTDCESGPAFILDGGTYGLLVPMEDAGALASGMSWARANPIPPETLRERAYHFSVERAADRYESLIDEFVSLDD